MKKFLSILMALILSVSAFGMFTPDVKAAEPQKVEGSLLLQDAEESEVTVDLLTKGLYLKSGTSRLVKKGPGMIGAGGYTVAQRTVNRLFIGVRVQRMENGRWVAYQYWKAEKKNDVSLSTSKLLKVGKGYYYRVFSTHIAGPDSTDSYTDGLWID